MAREREKERNERKHHFSYRRRRELNCGHTKANCKTDGFLFFILSLTEKKERKLNFIIEILFLRWLGWVSFINSSFTCGGVWVGWGVGDKEEKQKRWTKLKKITFHGSQHEIAKKMT